jgi:hypothetical protein
MKMYKQIVVYFWTDFYGNIRIGSSRIMFGNCCAFVGKVKYREGKEQTASFADVTEGFTAVRLLNTSELLSMLL